MNISGMLADDAKTPHAADVAQSNCHARFNLFYFFWFIRWRFAGAYLYFPHRGVIMAFTTYLVLPCPTQLGPLKTSRQKIVSCISGLPLTLSDYRENSSRWSDVGIVNSEGYIVCLDSSPEVLQEFRECEPIFGILTVYDQQKDMT